MTQQGANATAAPAATPVTASTYGVQSVPSANSNRFDQVKVSVLLFHLCQMIWIYSSLPVQFANLKEWMCPKSCQSGIEMYFVLSQF